MRSCPRNGYCLSLNALRSRLFSECTRKGARRTLACLGREHCPAHSLRCMFLPNSEPENLHPTFRHIVGNQVQSLVSRISGEVHMLSKCANPSCSTPLVYLREGKIFMMEHAPGQQRVSTPDQAGQASPAPRVEHFWLCGPCSAEMTLVYDRQAGILILPKTPRASKAAS